MSMLAERRRKQKWSLNPRGKDWSQDANKFGQKMLEKMGWQHGKGLGAKEDGIVEHVKISYKNDSKGMGYKESNDQWTQHESNFSALLETLSGESKKLDEIKINSLEKKSQSSRARVHYHKFTRGKDLSRYSEKDLANIFGKKTLKTEIKLEDVKKEDNQSESAQEKESSFLVNGGSMRDYFKSKLPNFGKSNGFIIGNDGVLKKDESDSESELRPSFGFGFKSVSDNSKVDSKDPTFVSYIADTTTTKRKAEDEILEEHNQIFSPKKKWKKGKENKISQGSGISNPAFQPMKIPMEITKNTLELTDETFSEETSIEGNNIITTEVEIHHENSNRNLAFDEKSSKKKRKKVNLDAITIENENSIDNLEIQELSTIPRANEHNANVSNIEIKDNSYEIKSNKRLKKNKKFADKSLDFNDNAEKIDVNMEFDNPNFNSVINDSMTSGKFEDNPYEVKPKQKKKKKKEKRAEFDNPTFENIDDTLTEPSQIKENPYEVKTKKKRKKDYENPTFNAVEDTLNNVVICDENPYEVKAKNKKKKKASKNETNGVVNDIETSDKHPSLSIIDNTYVKDKKKKIPKLSDVNSETENSYEGKSKKKDKKSKTKEHSGITNPALNLSISDHDGTSETVDECDLMLNIVSTPVENKKSVLTSGSISKVNSVKRRKSVRFSDVTQELVIPNNDDIRRMSSIDFTEEENGIDNVCFDKKQTQINEKIETLSKDIESYQAEIENDINENKLKTVKLEDIMIGEVGNPHGEDEKLSDGNVKLKFKNANFEARTPFYQLDKTGAKKSYKHLIKGDIVMKFKDSNLHEVKGYAVKKKRIVI